MDAARQLTTVFGSLSGARKGLLAVLAGGGVALAVLLYSWSTQTAFVTLYSGLDATDATKITDDLTTQNIPYQLAGGGTTIRVPEAQIDRLRMNFAAQGLPSGGNVGLELFDGNAFSATDFMQRVNYQRGLQGELARTIETFTAVEHARIHVVMPERSLFVVDERPATASVILQLRPGRTLSQDQVGGIAHLVSGAVEGLEKQHITVVDIGGNVLFDGAAMAEAGGSASSATHLQQQQKFERDLEREVQGLLDRAVGVGKSAVKVSATLNFDQQETETESFAPGQTGQGTPRSNTTVTEKYSTNGSAGTGAVPGAVANIPGANTSLTAAGTDNAATLYERSENTSNFEMGRTVQRVKQAPGRVNRMSVSLLLDESITEQQATDLQGAVSAAVGMNAERGDVIAVSRLAFDKGSLEQARAAFAEESSLDTYLGYGRLALPVVALIVGFVFFRMLLGALSKTVPAGATAATLAVATAGGRGLPMAASGGEIAARPGVPALAAPDETRSEVEKHVQTLAQGRPEAVAEVVQAWLREE